MGYTHGTKWTDLMVEKEILKVKDCLCLDRMPTRKEIELVTQNSKLTSKISKSKGFYWWAKKLNLPIKESETTLGKEYEYKVKDILEDKKFKVEKMKQNYAFDLLIDGNVKIDVKVAKPYVTDKFMYHTFNLYNKYASCDIYICVCLDSNKNIERLLIIPSSELKVTQLSVGKNSQYNKYNNCFNYIKKYSDFYKNSI